MIYTATVTRDGIIVASLSRSRPFAQDDANEYPDCALTADGVDYLAVSPPAPPLAARLDALEEAREAGIRKLRTQVAGALLANGWSQADTMAAGRDFFSSKTGHGTAIRAYIDGAAEDFVADVLADPREWLDLPAGGGLSIRELFAEALGA